MDIVLYVFVVAEQISRNYVPIIWKLLNLWRGRGSKLRVMNAILIDVVLQSSVVVDLISDDDLPLILKWWYLNSHVTAYGRICARKSSEKAYKETWRHGNASRY